MFSRQSKISHGSSVGQTKSKLIYVVTFLLLLGTTTTNAYIPGVNHRSIAGVWKLRQKRKSSFHQPQQQQQQKYPIKEFTVYPKDVSRSSSSARSTSPTAEEEDPKEILLMLKEDGSFQQYDDSETEDTSRNHEKVRIPEKLSFHKNDDAVLDTAIVLGRFQGKWDYVDGKLILAADRPKNMPKVEDTLLVGEVVAKKEQSLDDHPMTQNTTKEIKPSKFDTHLSVPKGKVNVGKFFYPKQHPSFFEQPMFSPTTKGKFELKQVLGSLNAQNPEDEEDNLIEKFRQTDFHGKRFLLTSHPIGNRKPKGNIRWSIKYNKFVEDPPSKKAKKAMEEEENRPANIRVMEVMFFANNTFATVGGLGESILRGKYHIVGHDRDQLWMQVWRFGFGRSVSGSVYSEGKSLTKEDEKTYWGTIKYEDEEETTGNTIENLKTHKSEDEGEDDDDNQDRRLIVKGSVIYGYGLEPQPVGRFVMTETTEEEEEFNFDDEDEEDDVERSLDILIEQSADDDDDDFLDWSDAFQ